MLATVDRHVAALCALGLLATATGSCGQQSERPGSTAQAPERWVQVATVDTVDRVAVARPAQREKNLAEISVQGDSLTLLVSDPSGRSSSWSSWGEPRSRGSLPRSKFSGIRVTEVDSGETAPSVELELLHPDSGDFRIMISARDQQVVYLHVGRRGNGAHDYGGDSDEITLDRGESVSWIASWTPGEPDSCWVRLKRELRAAPLPAKL